MFVSVGPRDSVANGSLRPRDPVEIAAQAHYLVGPRRFIEDLVAEGQVLDAHLRLVRHGPGAPAGDDDRD